MYKKPHPEPHVPLDHIYGAIQKDDGSADPSTDTNTMADD